MVPVVRRQPESLARYSGGLDRSEAAEPPEPRTGTVTAMTAAFRPSRGLVPSRWRHGDSLSRLTQTELRIRAGPDPGPVPNFRPPCRGRLAPTAAAQLPSLAQQGRMWLARRLQVFQFGARATWGRAWPHRDHRSRRSLCHRSTLAGTPAPGSGHGTAREQVTASSKSLAECQ